MSTPLARLTGEYEVLVVPADSPIKNLDDLVAKLKADPGSVTWGGGSAGGTDHIVAALIAKAVGVDADQGQLHRACRRRRGAELDPGRARHGRRQRLPGVREPDRGRQAARRSASPRTSRVAGIDVPTLKEQGVDVTLVNWRGVFAPPGDLGRRSEGAVGDGRQDGRDRSSGRTPSRSAAGSGSTCRTRSSPRSSPRTPRRSRRRSRPSAW